MVKLTHPDATGCSYAGVPYEPDDDGLFTVPEEAVAPLAAHGFTVAPEPKPAPKAAPKKGEK